MKNKIIRILLLILIIMLAVMNVAYASPTDIYTGGGDRLSNAGTYIAGWIRYAGIIICVIVLMLKGIKFITASPEGKADVKKELIPWAVGLVILVAFIPFINWVIELTQKNLNSIDHTIV